ncbi:hypothetical protein HZH66_000125 [Vespula vulgaris]|uniref:Uncharacterized protein n=1 Tax=Vespula vulgaris TaxID=7454 RepID=A0A834NKK4_VESVU|nr:hypothetical protein HZH66_000125 [Vespula vulgaris]
MVAKTFSKTRNKTKIRSVFYANDSRYFGCVNPKLGTPPIAKQKLPGAVAVAVAVTDDVASVGTGTGALVLVLLLLFRVKALTSSTIVSRSHLFVPLLFHSFVIEIE